MFHRHCCICVCRCVAVSGLHNYVSIGTAETERVDTGSMNFCMMQIEAVLVTLYMISGKINLAARLKIKRNRRNLLMTERQNGFNKTGKT